MRLNTLVDIENYFKTSVSALVKQCEAEDPWVFLTASVFLEYLTKLVNGENIDSSGYKKFIEDWMLEKYKDFTYRDGKQDLPLQMYHVLRCGMVHSFSFAPDDFALAKKCRADSISLAHRSNNKGINASHPMNYSGKSGEKDAAVFFAEDFIEDIRITVDKIFEQAKSDNNLKNKIMTWIKDHPPIMGGF